MHRILIIGILLLSVLCGLGFAAPNNVQGPNNNAKRLIKSMRAPKGFDGKPGSGRPARFTEKDGDLRSLSAPSGHYFSVEKKVSGDPSATAKNFIKEHGRAFGVRTDAVDFAVKKSKKKRGRNYERFQQRYSEVPVYGGEMIIQLNDDGDVEFAISDIMRNTDLLDDNVISTVPTISANDAKISAIALMAEEHPDVQLESTQPQLMIYDPEVIGNSGDVQLVWKTEVVGVSIVLVKELVLVDAHTGDIALHFTLIMDAREREVYDSDSSDALPGTLERAEGDPPTGIQDVDDAYDFLGDTYDFYFSEHGRDSINDAGMILSATVRFCPIPELCPFQNAFWDGARMIFGEGFATDDITGHELTHGVTQFESNLIYLNESGAINESFSDMWGEWIDQTNSAGDDSAAVKWLMGEDVPVLGAIRNMADPPQFNHPDSKCSLNWQDWLIDDSDNGGVHHNSGVGNKLCYLLTDGDIFMGIQIEGFGISKAADLFYEVQTNLLTAASDYADLHIVLIQAAINLDWSELERYNLEKACLVTELSKCFDPADLIDLIPPTPDPSEWEIEPVATGTHTIVMEVVRATDLNGVEYYFACTFTNDPNTPDPSVFDSGWQSNRRYLRGDYAKGKTYTFKVKTRDLSENLNETGWSSEVSATTDDPDDNLSPAPNPSRWEVKPKWIRLEPTPIIMMVAKESTDESGPVKYFFKCIDVDGGGPNATFDSGWQTSNTYSIMGGSLSIGSSYTFVVWAQDSVVDPGDNSGNNFTALSDPATIGLTQTGAGIYTVPAPYPTIQDAIDATQNDGDVVVIRPGIYQSIGNRDIDFKSKKITVRSTDPENPAVVAATIIDCQGMTDQRDFDTFGEFLPHRGFHFSGTENANSILSGLTITNGYIVTFEDPIEEPEPTGADGPDGQNSYGGGILCEGGSSPTISNCIITNCIVEGGWGNDGTDGAPGIPGIPADPNATPPIPGTPDIPPTSGGIGGDSGEAGGGGIYCDLNSNPIITGCQVLNCLAITGQTGNGGNGVDTNDPFAATNGGDGGRVGYPKGGGICSATSSSVSIVDTVVNACQVITQTTGGTGGLGGDEDEDLDGDRGFDAIGNGGGIFLDDLNQPGAFSGNTITSNSTEHSGGGLYCGRGTIITISDSEFAENLAGSATNFAYTNLPIEGGAILHEGGGQLTIDNCVIKQNTAFPLEGIFAPGSGGGVAAGSPGDPILIVINNSQISSNDSEFGGGLYLVNGDVEITDCTIDKNTALDGGGLWVFDSTVTIDGSAVSDNLAVGGSFGAGGGSAFFDSEVEIVNSVLTGNFSDGFGGAMFFQGWSVNPSEVTNCLVSGNSAFFDGGGLSCNLGAWIQMTNCTLVENNAIDIVGIGGGVSCAEDFALVEIFDSILWDNFAADGSQLAAGRISCSDSFFPTATIVVSYSDVQGGQDDVFMELLSVCPSGDAVVIFGQGNIDQDPIFVMDHYLSQTIAGQNVNSPCVDTGDPFSIFDVTDLTTRTDHKPDLGMVDMGYHHDATVPPLEFELTIEVVNPAVGTVTTDPNSLVPNLLVFKQGRVVDLEAKVNPIYENMYTVGKWIGADADDVTGFTNTVLMDSDKTVIFEFDVDPAQYALLRTIVETNNGDITVGPDPNFILKIPTGDLYTKEYVYELGSVVTLTTLPEDEFLTSYPRWGGTDNDDELSRTNTVTLDTSKTVTVRHFVFDTLIVGPGGPGVYTSIQLAIEDAQENDVIMVMPGTYDIYESGQPDELSRILINGKNIILRSFTPDIPENTIILGGFEILNVGRNTIIDGFQITGQYGGVKRNWDSPPSGLDGRHGPQISGAGMRLFEYAPPRLANSRFTIALPHDDTVQNSSPTVRNCIFLNCWALGNHGGDGASGTGDGADGITVPGEPGHGGWAGWAHGGAVAIGSGASPLFENCQFIGNIARGGDGGNGGDAAPALGGHGGTWGNPSGDPSSLLTWEAGPFEQYWNYSGYGGAVYCGNDSTPEFRDCTFSDNIAEGGSCGISGANYWLVPEERFRWPLEHYRIDRFGGAVYGARGSSPKFENCTFNNNEADPVGPEFYVDGSLTVSDDDLISFGGAVAFETDSTPTFIDCTFEGNVAVLAGGMYSLQADPTITRCSFVNNTALFHAGGLALLEGGGQVRESTFSQNTASDVSGKGGGIYCFDNNTLIVDSTINANTSNGSGGGVYISGANTVELKNCLITANIAGSDGGGVSANWFAQTIISNCTIAGNKAENVISLGGGLHTAYFSNVIVTDSILWDNQAVAGSQISIGNDEDAGLFDSVVSISYSDIQFGEENIYLVHGNALVNWGDPGDLPGSTPIDNDPLFVTGTPGNYFLSQPPAQTLLSPCVNTGSTDANSLGLNIYTTSTNSDSDIDTVDMGYHFPDFEDSLVSYQLTVTVIGDNGTVQIPTETGSVSGTSVSNSYLNGQEVVVTAFPAQGFRIANWAGDVEDLLSVELTNTVIMDADKAVEVSFQPNVTITVPGDYTSIQTAIDAARAGDIVKISQGVFHNATGIVVDKPVTITGSNPDDPGVVANTIIDGTGYPTRGFIFTENAGPGTVLNGITIVNMNFGWADPEDPEGPGVDGFDGNLTFGGGIVCLPGSSPTIKNTVIRDCDTFGQNGSAGTQGDDTAPRNGRGGWGGAAYGGGIYIAGQEHPSATPGVVTNPTFINCTIMNNSVTGGNGGNGADYATITIGDDDFNIAPGYGGLWSRSNNPATTWTNLNVRYGLGDYRYYSGYGGGVYCGEGTKPTFIHCLITGNTTLGGMSGIGGANEFGIRQAPAYNYEIPSYGGGVYCGAGSEVEFIDCTITDNVSPKFTLYETGDTIAEEALEAFNEVGEPRYHLNPYLGHGGGIALDHATSVRFENCYIRGSEASMGGGIFWGYEPETQKPDLELNGTIEIVDCNIVDNLAYLGAGVFGNKGNAMINSSLISGNFGGPTIIDVDDLGGQGGGIHIDSASVDILNSQIVDNTTNLSGGGIFLTGQSPDETTIRNCLVTGNEAGRDGGGISVNWSSSPFIENCTIADNIASGTFGQSGLGFGGGLSTAYSSNATVTNSIFWGNFGQIGDQIVVATDFEFDFRPSILELSYSVVQDGWSGIFVGTGCTLTFGPPDANDLFRTNIDSDPCFVNDPCFIDDYYLNQPPNQINTSPGVDTGNAAADSICLEAPDGGTICLDEYTTSTDNELDIGMVDMGYHHPLPVSLIQVQLDSCGLCDFPATRDGSIDGFDLIQMAMWWLDRTCAGAPFCDGTDVSGNGEVNNEDFGLCASCWLEQDNETPAPDPSLWALGGEPKAGGETSIVMAAETAIDNWGIVEYNFINDSGGCNSSGWQSDPCYVDTGLTSGMFCTYHVITRDRAGNVTGSSELKSAFVGNDTEPPVPDPSEWLLTPRSDPLTPTTIDMSAVITDDPPPFSNNPVWYSFECTDVDGLGLDETFDSGWQIGVDSNIYTRNDYVAGSVYTFTVKTRDSSMNQNETAPSPEATVTAGIGPDTLPPDPIANDPPLQNPEMTWASPPVNAQIPLLVGSYYNVMIASTAIDPAPAGYEGGNDVEYFFECLEDSGLSSGWIPIDPGTGTAYYAVQVGDQFDVYRFRVMARDTSPLNNATDWSCYCYAGDNPASCGCLGP